MTTPAPAPARPATDPRPAVPDLSGILAALCRALHQITRAMDCRVGDDSTAHLVNLGVHPADAALIAGHIAAHPPGA